MGVKPENLVQVRTLLKSEFRRNKDEVDNQKIQALRENAIRGISNYIIMTVKDEYQKNPYKKQIFEADSDDEGLKRSSNP